MTLNQANMRQLGQKTANLLLLGQMYVLNKVGIKLLLLTIHINPTCTIKGYLVHSSTKSPPLLFCGALRSSIYKVAVVNVVLNLHNKIS